MTVMQVAKTRYEVFDKAFVSRHLAEDDKRIRALNGKGIGKGCHPDAGMGRWADKLPIDQWWRFNKAQRAAGNYLEAICPLTAFLLIVGAYHPLTATAQGVAYTYAAAASVSSVWPVQGSAEGGTPVTVHGAHFSAASEASSDPLEHGALADDQLAHQQANQLSGQWGRLGHNSQAIISRVQLWLYVRDMCVLGRVRLLLAVVGGGVAGVVMSCVCV